VLPILDKDRGKALEEAQAAIDAFPERFGRAYLERFRSKLGLRETHPEDADLIHVLLQTIADTSADFTNSFRALCDAAEGKDDRIRAELGHTPSGDAWLQRWSHRLSREVIEPAAQAAHMRRENPSVIPRNHRVEAVLEAAISGELDPLEHLLRVLASPWDERPQSWPYRCPPGPHEVVRQTFCGT
jgi:uncharacterized protein YdiU (UPF0061 family)